MNATVNADVIIAGAGPAGLSLAAALADAPLRIMLIERLKLGALSEPKFDGREIALTHTSVTRLRSLGAWDRVPASQIFPLKRARVLNGQSSFALSFDSRREGEALGTLVPNAAIRRALFDIVGEQRNCDVITNRAVTSLRAQEGFIEVLATGSTRLRARLAVAADTRFSSLRQSQGISAQMIDFGRSMLVCRMSHTRPHDAVATEWFGHGQTVAMLPLQEGMSSYILTLPAREISALMEMTPASFARDAERRTQARWGQMRLASTRHAYPLVAVYADRFVAQRFALMGDAAVGMHPITAHGYNFGLAGAVTLAREVMRAAGFGGDVGGLDGLLRYERSHRHATWPLFTATNALAKLYTDERALPRLARAAGLRLMQAVSPMRHAVEAQLSA
jgi:ubiquinone biosynthesis UbiH/UbiF/VisC/COQ6 family hydroxylase